MPAMTDCIMARLGCRSYAYFLGELRAAMFAHLSSISRIALVPQFIK
jgi:hypothetical protein